MAEVGNMALPAKILKKGIEVCMQSFFVLVSIFTFLFLLSYFCQKYTLTRIWSGEYLLQYATIVV